MYGDGRLAKPALRRARPHLVAKLVNDEGEGGGGQMRPLVVLLHPFTFYPLLSSASEPVETP